MSWRTLRFQIRYNPENIQGMVKRMAHCSFLRCQRERELRRSERQREPF